MPWTVEENGGTCGDETPWAVLDEEGATESCHATEADAVARVEALDEQESAAGAPGEAATGGGGRWEAVLVIEDERTADGREIAAGALSWRTLPLPLMLMTENSAMGHDGARIAGSIETIERVGSELRATGTFDTGDDGAEAQRLVTAQTLRWVSADISPTEWEVIEEGDCSEEGWMSGECNLIERVNEGLVMGATVCPFPAFPTAVIVPEGASIPEASENGRAAAAAVGIVAGASLVAAGGPAAPPSSWFTNPVLGGPTPLTVADDGRVFGHLATWGTCHTGVSNVCTTPPRSRASYAYARTGEVVTAEGTRVPVGHITLGGGHADGRAGYRAAAAHYDDVGAAVADVAYGEDAFGIWMAGALRPDVTDEQVRTLRASAPSGDWRRIGGNLELVATLAVNVPGFPIVRSLAASGRPASTIQARALVVHGEQVSLVAAGIVVADPMGDRLAAIEVELARQARVMEPLLPLAVERLTARVASGKPA